MYGYSPGGAYGVSWVEWAVFFLKPDERQLDINLFIYEKDI